MKLKNWFIAFLFALFAVALYATTIEEATSNLPKPVPNPQSTLHGNIRGDQHTITNTPAILGTIVTNIVYIQYRTEDLRNCFWSPSTRIFYKGEIRNIEGEDRLYYIAITNVNLFVDGIPDSLR